MKSHRIVARFAIGMICGVGIGACTGSGSGGSIGVAYNRPVIGVGAQQPVSGYSIDVLVSNGATLSAQVDANLANPWGLAFAPGAPVWILNNRSNTATQYDGAGVQTGAIQIPVVPRGYAYPTGIVVNVSTDFVISATTGPAAYIFCGESGGIFAWAPKSTSAVTMFSDRNGGAVYKGVAIATNNGANLLYATDFRNNKIDVFDKNFAKVSVSGNFSDSGMPAGFAPFGIQAIGNQLYVSYAKQLEPDNREIVAGAGFGYVNLFSPNGTLIRRIASAGVLNAPWGMAVAPSGFGELSGALLIANFGDGTINAFEPITAFTIGPLNDERGNAIVIPGLWGLAFGNGAYSQPTTTLYFTAGPNREADGEYGAITTAK